MEDENIKKLELENALEEMDLSDNAKAKPEKRPAKTEKPKKCKAKMVICAAVMLVLAGFGGFMTLLNFKAQKHAEDLDAEIAAKNAEIEELKASDSEEKVDKEDVAEAPKPSVTSGPYINDNYFYVPEWGWKFKIPSDLTGLGFAVDYDEAHVGYDLPFIGFTAVQKSDLVENPQGQYYDSILTCSVISVNKTQKDKNNYSLLEDDKEIDGAILRISNYSSDFCSFDRNVDQVYAKLRTMFQNPENI